MGIRAFAPLGTFGTVTDFKYKNKNNY